VRPLPIPILADTVRASARTLRYINMVYSKVKRMSPNDIDLSSLEFLAHPYPTYQKLREANAPFWLAHGGRRQGFWSKTHGCVVPECCRTL
jgi:hypothetical protein